MDGLLGEPLELVQCETSDLWVPAHAEMMIESENLPHQRTAQGPTLEAYAPRHHIPRELWQRINLKDYLS